MFNREVAARYITNLFRSGESMTNDMTTRFVKAESRILPTCPDDGEICRFLGDENTDATFVICVKAGALHFIYQDKQHYIDLERHASFSELCDKGKQMDKALDEAKFTFAPYPTKDFITAITSAEQGAMINLNNKMSVVCVQENDQKKIFKQVFSGSLANISLDGFNQSREFVIAENSVHDIHYMYGKAYECRTNTAELRVTECDYRGHYLCTQLESDLKEGQNKTIRIGSLALIVQKRQNRCIWYDKNMDIVERDKVAAILAWANSTIPEVNIRTWMSNEIADGFDTFEDHNEYSELLQKINQCTKDKDFVGIVNMAFKFSKESECTMSITFEDLINDKEGNYIPCAIAFVNDAIKGSHIYLLAYHEGLYRGDPEIKEMSQEEFCQYCEVKYDKTYHSIINQNEKAICQIEAKVGSRAEAERLLIEYMQTQKERNFLGISETDMKKLRQEVADIVKDIAVRNTDESISDWIEDMEDR